MHSAVPGSCPPCYLQPTVEQQLMKDQMLQQLRTRLILHFNRLPAVAGQRVSGGPQDAAVSAALDAAEDDSIVRVRKQLQR